MRVLFLTMFFYPFENLKISDDMLKSLRDEQPQVEEEPEEEYEVLYLCTYDGCGRSFTDQGALRKHTNIHGEKQFVCHYEGCGKVALVFALCN